MTCLQEKHSAINSGETPLIFCNTTLTCLLPRRWTARLPRNKITKLLLMRKHFNLSLTLISNTTLTCFLPRRWTAPLPQNKITKLLLMRKHFNLSLTLISNTTLTCFLPRRWTAPLPQNKITKLLLMRKHFDLSLTLIRRRFYSFQPHAFCIHMTHELDRNGFPNPDYKSEKKNRLESHPIHEQIAHVYVKHCGSVFCGLIHSSEISVADAVAYA